MSDSVFKGLEKLQLSITWNILCKKNSDLTPYIS